ncbi:unnamed protein product [Camellia sinensis]
MENSPTFVVPLFLNILTSLFIFADKSLLTLAERYKLLQLLRCFLISSFLFLLRLLPHPSLSLSPETYNYSHKPPKSQNYVPPAASAAGYGGGGGGGGSGDSGIARALSQLLSIVTDIPVSSRKYEVVRSLAERLIEENLQEQSEPLRAVNCAVLLAAFSRTLRQFEAAVMDRDQKRDLGGPSGEAMTTGEKREGGDYKKVRRVLRAVRDVAWTRFGKSREEMNRRGLGSSAEKLAAEVLWLAQKMAACGCVEEAVEKWASATQLAWLALFAEPRLQGSLVKVSAFLFKQAKVLGAEVDEESKKEQQRQTKMKMLMSWLPLLCRASNGTDSPVLSINERAELERVLEEIIDMLEEEEDQEKVLSLWLHHFTYCPSSDWPNLRACYTRWCNASRKALASPMRYMS